jgi:Putative porin
LASAFRDLVVSTRLDLGHFDPVHIILDGEYVRNLAWNKDDIAAKALANPIPAGPTLGCSAPPCPNVYTGGNQGWLARMTVGHPKLKQLWDWNAFVGYKYLESDAVIDAFADSDFGLGGTNLKGYFVGGNVALGPNVWASVRWMSANQVAGAPYAVDIVQFDLNAKF